MKAILLSVIAVALPAMSTPSAAATYPKNYAATTFEKASAAAAIDGKPIVLFISSTN